MKIIKIKFHRVVKYEDPEGLFSVHVEYGHNGHQQIVCKMTCSCKDGVLPDIETGLGPFNPESLVKIEKVLKLSESEGKIRNLILEEPIELEGIEIEMKRSQIEMN